MSRLKKDGINHPPMLTETIKGNKELQNICEQIMPVILMGYYVRCVSVLLKPNKRLVSGSGATRLIVVSFQLCHPGCTAPPSSSSTSVCTVITAKNAVYHLPKLCFLITAESLNTLAEPTQAVHILCCALVQPHTSICSANTVYVPYRCV